MQPDMQSDLQHVGLPTACAIVYAKISGSVPDPREAASLDAILNDVAFALSNLVPIHAPDPVSGLPKALSPLELVEGRFSRGAHVFTAGDGEERRGLTVQRRDMNNAIAILRAAGVQFPRRGLLPG